MKAKIRNFHALAYENGHTMWLYQVFDRPLQDAMIPGFFDEFADMLSVGDQITISGIGGAIVFVITADRTGVIVAPPVMLGVV